MITIDKLIGVVGRRSGFAKPNRFMVDMSNVVAKLNLGSDVNAAHDLNILVDNINMPGRTLSTIEYSIWNHNVKIPHGYEEDDITITFNLTGDFFIKRLLDEWHKKVIDHSTYLLSYAEDYLCDIKIYALGEKNEKNYGVHIKGAYPTAVRGLLLDNNSESTIAKIETVLSYQRWESI